MSTQGDPGLNQSQYETFRCSSDLVNVPSKGRKIAAPLTSMLDAKDELINKTHRLARPRLWSSMMGLMEVGVVLVASRSKSCRKVKKLSKSPKNLKGLKKLRRPPVRRNVYQSTDPLSVHRYELGLPSDLLSPRALSIPPPHQLSTRQN